MRLYDYQCDKCKMEFTYLQESHEEKDNAPKCPYCGAKKPRRVPSYVHIKNSNPPWSPRHRRGQMAVKPSRKLPLFSIDDLKKKKAKK